MFSCIKTPEGITNLPITIYALLSIFWISGCMRFFADSHSRPAPPRPSPRIFTLAPPRPAEKCFAPHIPGRLPKGALHLTRRCPFNPIYPSNIAPPCYVHLRWRFLFQLDFGDPGKKNWSIKAASKMSFMFQLYHVLSQNCWKEPPLFSKKFLWEQLIFLLQNATFIKCCQLMKT